MLKALLLKEWRQLRPLRWTGLGLGAMLPLVLLASAEASQRGWLPSQKIAGYSPETLFLEVYPLVLLALWGLMGLLISSQAFGGDRAEGTESFLLERPVKRGHIWRARLLAGLGTLLAVTLGHVLVWWPFAVAVRSEAPVWDGALQLIGYGGALTATVAFLAGLAAASLLNSPLQGVLLGIVLGVLPIAAAQILSGLFPFASYRGTPVGVVLPLLLLGAYLVGSFAMLCRGEPAGRGRLRRGGLVLGVGVVAMPLLFLIGAPLAMRAEAARLDQGVEVHPGAGALAVAVNEEHASGWILDLEGRRRVRFLAPPVYQTLLNSDGSRLAVIRSAGGFGRFSARVRTDIYDATGRVISRVKVEPDLQFFGEAFWAEGHLVIRTYDSLHGGLLIVDPQTGRQRGIALDVSPRNWVLLGPDERDRLYVLRARDDDWPASTAVLLQRVDIARGELDPVPLLEEEGFPPGESQSFSYFYQHEISPGGRYLTGPGRGYVDLTTGRTHARHGSTRPEWMRGDRLAWLEREGATTRLLWGAPGEPGRTLRSWTGGQVSVAASPDRERLLVKVYTEGSDRSAFRRESGLDVAADARIRELWVYEASADRWVEATDSSAPPPLVAEQRVGWAGPHTLALMGPGALALRDLDPSHRPRYLIGSP